MTITDLSKQKTKALIQRVRGVGLRHQLVLGFTVFVLISLLIVWFFQFFMLDFIYERTKLSEVDLVLESIEDNIDDESLDMICADLSVSHDVCISIYSIVDNHLGELIMTQDVSPTCVIHYVNDTALEYYYRQSVESGGVWTQRYILKQTENDGNSENSIMPEDNDENYDHDDERKRVIVAVSSKLIGDSAGNNYAVFINICFTPVSAIHQTRTMQFVYIALAIALASAAFAWFFSRKISKPLERMTAAAENIAYGDYSSTFKVEGYLETRRLAKTLNYAVNEISRTDNLRKELIANISHDLRTPLTLITGYAEMMRDIPGENTPENTQHIIDETKRLTELVNDMLDFSKYSVGIQKPEIALFNFTESVRTTMNRYSELVRQNGFNLSFDYDEEIYVEADERMILQVIYNLLNNAINYTGADKSVDIKQTVHGNIVRLTVTDTGQGISKDDLPLIWDRYYKVDKTHIRSVLGSGLGLSIVRSLLELHAASYGVESTEGVGSSFWFELNIFDK